jgi:hypothetical protein
VSRSASAGLAFAAAVASCAPVVRFDTNVAPDFKAGLHSVSVFGVYKDGQMSSESWGAIGPRISAALGSHGAAPCEEGYASALSAGGGGLVAAIDDYARANGPTDELVALLAPAAKGDLVLTLTVAGRPPVPEKASAVDDPSSRSQMGQQPGRPSKAGAHAHGPVDTNALDIAASFFSVSQKRSVAEVAMEYTGETVDDALARFASKLAATVPSATCAGWNWNSQIDAEHVRQKLSE